MVLPAWGLTDRDQTGLDELLSSTVSTLTCQEPELWSLFSTQGSTAIIRADEGFVAANRGRLKSKADLSAAFVLPAGTQITSQDLQRVGEFVIGRVVLTAEIQAPQVGEVVGVQPLGDVWDAFWWDENKFRIRRPGPRVKTRPKTIEQSWQATLGAIQDGPKRSWRYVSLTITPMVQSSDEAAVGGVVETLRTWERSVMQGDVSELSRYLYDDPFCAAAYTPDGQAWFFTYPEYLTTMLSSALAMGSADRSMMVNLDVSTSGPVATVVGQWDVDIPMLGSMRMGLTCALVKEQDRWMMVSLCGGMLED